MVSNGLSIGGFPSNAEAWDRTFGVEKTETKIIIWQTARHTFFPLYFIQNHNSNTAYCYIFTRLTAFTEKVINT